MKKKEIRVTIDSVEKQQKAIEILERYGEEILNDKIAMEFDVFWNTLFLGKKNRWLVCVEETNLNRTEITLDQLEEILKNEKK